MKRVNCFWFYQLSKFLVPLASLESPVKVKDAIFTLHVAKEWLESFLSDSIVTVPLCKGRGRDIIIAIDKVLAGDWDTDIVDGSPYH